MCSLPSLVGEGSLTLGQEEVLKFVARRSDYHTANLRQSFAAKPVSSMYFY